MLVGTQAFGEMCAVDNVPAATLLVPYFSVGTAYCPNDPIAGGGTGTTFINITNASAAPIVAHVTVWTDWSIPEIDFDIFLTGYDVQSFDMANIFCSDMDFSGVPGGDLPMTWWGNFNGPYSILGANPSACGTAAGAPPRYADGAIVPGFQSFLRDVFLGLPDAAGDYHGTAGDGSWHGYVTVDANNNCSLDFPSQPIYWTSGVTYNDELGNVLMGDYQYLDLAGRTSEGFTALHIEAFGAIAAGAGPSFYGRYLGTGADGREPLPTTYGSRYNANGAVDSTDFQIWRTGGAATAPGTNPWALCNTADQCAGIDVNFALAFNNDEQVIITTGGPSGGPAQAEVCIDWETQELDVYWDLDAGFDNGWYYLNLQSSCTDGQAYLTVTQDLDVGGVFSGGWDGIALDGSCTQFAAGVTVFPAQPTVLNPSLQ
jgi:hypothetical protein